MTLDACAVMNAAEQKVIIGYVLNLEATNGSAKARQISQVAKSNNRGRSVTVTMGVHSHGPAPASVYWFTLDLVDGNDTLETVHVYVTSYGYPPAHDVLFPNKDAVPGIGKPAGTSISVENKLKPGIAWY